MTYTAPIRSWRGGLALALMWALLLLGYLRFDAEGWIVGTLAVLTLPALWDLISGRAAGLRLDDTMLEWHNGTGQDRVALSDLDHVRLDWRFDFSMRVTLVLRDGRRQKLPQDALPPADLLEAALRTHGVKTERHPFSLF